MHTPARPRVSRTKLACAALLLATAPLHAASWYVKPDGSGNDANAGTLSAPFKTISKAQTMASAGDIVYLIGAPQAGEWNTFTLMGTDANYNYVHILNKSGITYKAYSTSKPVFNFSGISTSLRPCGFLVSGSNITVEGIEIKNLPVGAQKQAEVFRVTGNTNTFRKLSIHNNAANGLYTTGNATGILVEDCDSYNNIGTTTTAAGNTDGFGSHAGTTTFRRCRAWNNSDDGYDCITSKGSVTFDSCWAYNHNGAGNKTGFKVGGYGTGTPPATVPVHTVTGCLSADNGANGFYANHQPGKSANWTNNTAYSNSGANYNMLERVSTTDATDIPGYREEFHYNIAYSGTTIVSDNHAAALKTNNSWTKAGVTVSSADFQSLDATQMMAARPSTGVLPTITFMKLVSGSDLVGMGY